MIHTDAQVTARRGAEGLDWRWKLAKECAPDVTIRELFADAALHSATNYWRDCQGGPEGPERARRCYPLVAAAQELTHNSDALQIATIAGCPAAEIAARLQVPEDVLGMWEALFFDVRGLRQATDWVVLKVITPARVYGSPELASSLKLAFAGGPVAAWAIIDVGRGLPLAAGESWLNRRLRLDARMERALSLPLDTGADGLRLVKVMADMLIAEKKLALDKKKLEAGCEEARRRHERALVKLRARQAGSRHAGENGPLDVATPGCASNMDVPAGERPGSSAVGPAAGLDQGHDQSQVGAYSQPAMKSA